MGLGKLMPTRYLRPSEASTARPIACPGGGVRKITWEVPAMTLGETRALAGPRDSRCLATISSGLIFSAPAGVGAARAKHSKAKAVSHFCRTFFWLSLISFPRCQKPDRQGGQ